VYGDWRDVKRLLSCDASYLPPFPVYLFANIDGQYSFLGIDCYYNKIAIQRLIMLPSVQGP